MAHLLRHLQPFRSPGRFQERKLLAGGPVGWFRYLSSCLPATLVVYPRSIRARPGSKPRREPPAPVSESSAFCHRSWRRRPVRPSRPRQGSAA